MWDQSQNFLTKETMGITNFSYLQSHITIRDLCTISSSKDTASAASLKLLYP